MIKINKKINVIGLVFIVIILAGFGMFKFYKNKPKNFELSSKMPSDFNFILSYGVNSKNIIDTTKSKYTKDMITEKPISIELKFTNKEMEDIYEEMRNIDILNYPDVYKPQSDSHITPYETYKLKIIAGGFEKELYWEDNSKTEIKQAVQLRNLFDKIHRIISEKEEYKKLPVPKGGYM